MSNLLIPPILFFSLGFLAQLMRSNLRFPPDLGKALAIYLLVGIGLHGGEQLAQAQLGVALAAIFWALVLGIVLPLLAYRILYQVGRIDKLNAAAIAAHYGSVSVGTFLTAQAFLDVYQVSYETYPLIMLAIMEFPAIIIGLLLASLARQEATLATSVASKAIVKPHSWIDLIRQQPRVLGELLKEALTNGSVVLLLGSLFIGYSANPAGLAKIKPFFNNMFMGALCLFLLEMGMDAAKRIGQFRKVGLFLVSFGIVMPLLSAVIGLLVGRLLGFGVGGITLVSVLAASASYIAVPPAMRLAIPEANPSFYLTLSLGITFPFNVLIGIPLYYRWANWIVG